MNRLSKPELVILAGVSIMLLAILLPGAAVIERQRRLRAARADLRVLVDAVMRFHEEYGRWPGAPDSPVGDARLGGREPNTRVMNALLGLAGPGNEGHASNPNRIVFLEPAAAARGRGGIDDAGEYADPWGAPYQFVLDTDHSGFCDVENSIYGIGNAGGVLVWSCGPDRRSDTEDDVLSWRR